MNVFLDTEFYSHGDTIEPISIALCSEKGSEYYAEFAEFKLEENDNSEDATWLRKNVLPKLTGSACPRNVIRDDLTYWLLAREATDIWAWYGAYDWVVLINVLGWKNKPKKIHPVHRELRDLALPKDITIVNTNEHHALSDAKWNHEVWRQSTKEK